MPHCMNASVKKENVTEIKMLVNLKNESVEGASTAKSQQMQPILFAVVMPLDCQTLWAPMAPSDRAASWARPPRAQPQGS